jgi:ABC-type multidrug transport system fused ATPase/permease subunit
LTTVEKCSRVAVLEDGVIVEEGSFKDLHNRKDGYFAKLSTKLEKKKTD